MASLIINTVRNVVPNWRDYKTTAELGELNGNNSTVQNLPFFSIDGEIGVFPPTRTGLSRSLWGLKTA